MFKLKRSTLLFLIVLLPFVATAVCLSIFSAPSAQAQIILYVDDDTCPRYAFIRITSNYSRENA